MRNARRISRFVTAYARAAFQVIVLGGTAHLSEQAGVRRHRPTT